MVIKRIGRPIKPNSKKENPVCPVSSKALLTIIFGGVPVKVNNPPEFDPNAIGINTLDGNVPSFQAVEIDTGNKVATVPVLLTKPESTPEPKVKITTIFVVLLFANFTNVFPAKAVQPVLDNPSPMTNKDAIIITVGLLNPLSVSGKSKTPVKNSANIDIKATTSGDNFPQTKNAIVIPKMMKVVVIILLCFGRTSK